MWGIETPLGQLAAVTLQSAWLIPYEGEAYWMIPAASLFLLVPFLLASVRIERKLLHSRWTEVPPDKTASAVVVANLTSYSLLAVMWVIFLIMALVGRPVFR